MEPKTFTLTVSAEEINIISAGLSELPYRVSATWTEEVVAAYQASLNANP